MKRVVDRKVEEDGRCSKHPKYKARRRPECNCLDCWKLYALAMEEERDHYESLSYSNADED